MKRILATMLLSLLLATTACNDKPVEDTGVKIINAVDKNTAANNSADKPQANLVDTDDLDPSSLDEDDIKNLSYNLMRELQEPGAIEAEIAKRYQVIYEARLKQGFKEGEDKLELQVRQDLAMTFQLQNKLVDAEMKLKENVVRFENDPKLGPLALSILGRFYAMNNRENDALPLFEKALRNIQKAIEDDPTNIELHKLHMSLLMLTNKIEEGRSYYERMAKEYPDVPILKEAVKNFDNMNKIKQGFPSGQK